MTTDRYNGSLRLRRKYGMRGYGIYSRIVELILSASNKRIKYDVDDLVYDMREDAEIIKDVAENFGLFDLVDGYLEDPYSKTPEAIKAEIEAKKAAARSEASRKAAATRKAKREAEKAKQQQEQPTRGAVTKVLESIQTVQTPERVTAPAPDDPSPTAETFEDPRSELFEQVKNEWNKRFGRTYRRYAALNPDSIVWNNFLSSSKTYELRDYIDAFDQATNETFVWQFKDVLKPSNMQRLLSNAEIERARKRQNEPVVDYQTQEMIDYASANKLNWDEL